MKLLALEIEGFGVWSGLKFQRMCESLNVVYGPNEAGKSTLLHFVRSALYGFSADRRRYLPPIHGGRPGGWLEVAGAGGQFQIARYASPDGNPRLDETLITAADGARQNEQFVQTLLANIDETTFNNVFAVSLSEMQELATLSDTQAADVFITSLPAWTGSRWSRLPGTWKRRGPTFSTRTVARARLTQLMQQREQIRRQIEEQQSHAHGYARMAGDRDGIERELSQLEKEQGELRQQLDLRDLAVAVRDRWRRHRALGEELSSLGPQIAVPADALERLETVKERAKKRQAGIERLHRHRQSLLREAEALNVNEALGRHGARITATLEQEPWLRALESQIAEREKQRDDLNATMFAEYEKMGLGKPAKPDRLPHFSPQALTELRQPGHRVEECLKKCRSFQREAEDAQQAAAGVQAQVTAALNERQATDLTSATEQAGNLVNQLRRRMQLDERLEQMSRNEKELQEQAQRCWKSRCPRSTRSSCWAVIFVVGVLILALGLLVFPSWTGPGFWTLAAVGLLIAVGACWAGTPCSVPTTSSLKRDRSSCGCCKCRSSRPRTSGPCWTTSYPAAAARWPAAWPRPSGNWRPWKTWPRWIPGMRRPGRTPTPPRAARTRPKRTSASPAGPGTRAWKRPACRRTSRRGTSARWHAWPATSATCNLAFRSWTRSSASAAASATCCTAASPNWWPIAASRSSRSIPWKRSWSFLRCSPGKRPALPAARSSAAACASFAMRGPKARRPSPVHHRAASSCCGSSGPRAKSICSAWWPRPPGSKTCATNTSRSQHDLAATIGTRASQADLRQHIEGPAAAHLDASRDDLRARLAGIEKEIHQRIEKRGQLNAQMKSLADDRQLAARQLDLATLQQRIDEAIGRWQVLAVTGQILESIRASYETDRQPETLQEASGYFSQMTQGHYRRVWTPVGERVLRVEDDAGALAARRGSQPRGAESSCS